MSKSQIIKFEQNIDGVSVEDNSILFVRVPVNAQSPDVTFEIPPTHNALLIIGGNRRYYSGEDGAENYNIYNVFNNKQEIEAWKKGATIEVIYMPKKTNIEIYWGTHDKFEYRDEFSNQVIQVGARGETRISIVQPEQFFLKKVGAAKKFLKDKFADEFRSDIISEFRDTFLKVVNEKKLTYDKFDANLSYIASEIEETLSEKFIKSWGIKLVDFKIHALAIDQEDKDKIEEFAAEAKKQEKLKEYLAELERLDDKQWEREKYLRQLELNDRAAYYEVLKVIGHPHNVGNHGGNTPGVANVFCPNCGNSVSQGDIFCPKCGKRIVKETKPCPNCGKSNDGEATFCSACGTKL